MLLIISVIVATAAVGLTAYLFLIADDADTALVTGVFAAAMMMDCVLLSWLLRRAEQGNRP